MDTVVLPDIPFTVDESDLLTRLRLSRDNEYTERTLGLAREAATIAKPKGLYRLAQIEERGEDYVIADGVKLTSKLLAGNLADTRTFVAYLATSGVEIAEWAKGLSDMLDAYAADVLQDLARLAAVSTIIGKVDVAFQLTNASGMNPGSLPDWPLTQQKQLFALFAGTHEAIGVTLTDSMLMVPIKTVSGIRFSAAHSFVNCQLCPRVKCPNRRAPYDEKAGDIGQCFTAEATDAPVASGHISK